MINNSSCFDTNKPITREFCDNITRTMDRCSMNCLDLEENCLKNEKCKPLNNNKTLIYCGRNITFVRRCQYSNRICNECEDNKFLEFYWPYCKNFEPDFDTNLPITSELCSEVLTNLTKCNRNYRTYHKKCHIAMPSLSHKDCLLHLINFQNCDKNSKLIFYNKKCIAQNATFDTNLEITPELCANITAQTHNYEKNCRISNIHCIKTKDGYTGNIDPDTPQNIITFNNNLCFNSIQTCYKIIQDHFVRYYKSDCKKLDEVVDKTVNINCEEFSAQSSDCKRNCRLYIKHCEADIRPNHRICNEYHNKCQFCVRNKKYVYYRNQCLIRENLTK